MENMIELVSEFYQLIGIQRDVTSGDVYGIISMMVILLASMVILFVALRKGRVAKRDEQTYGKGEEVLGREELEKKLEEEFKKAPAELEQTGPDHDELQTPEITVKPTPEPQVKISWQERLVKGLSRSREEIWGKLGSILGQKKLDDDTLEEIEEVLYSADIGPKAVAEMIDDLESKRDGQEWSPESLKKYLKNFLLSKMEEYQSEAPKVLYEYNKSNHPGTQVIMVVGVNGAGKTTTIGKLATKLTRQGAKVVVGACDTFRAAAVDQLQVWCDRAGAEMIRAKEGSNPSGVGFSALEQALAQKADYCILDTAGRLHTKSNLMDELKKSRDVLKKLDPGAPHHLLLVIDAITGQNALRQAEEFNKALDLSGLILTKCDGSSKAGSAVGIVQELKVPIVYIGVGESVEDLNRFDLNLYLDALLGNSSDPLPDDAQESSTIDVSP